MKAVLCKAFGPISNLVVEDVPSPRPDKGQVVVSVHAAGVNFPDTLIVEGRYQFKPELPFSPGSETAGIVKEVGEGVTGYRPGDRVIAHSVWGGYAEEVVVSADRLMRVPEGVDLAVASAFVTTYGTSYHGLKDRADLKPGETLLVLGAAGGVGLSAVELGKMMGARVIAAASSEEKLALCRKYGADDTIDYSREDLKERIKELTKGRGVDVVYDPLGGKYSEPALRGMAWKGRFLVIGFAAGEIPKIPLNLALLKGCSIVGVFYGASLSHDVEGSEKLVAELLELLRQGKLKPHISATYPLAEATRALNDILERKVKGKAVLVTDQYRPA